MERRAASAFMCLCLTLAPISCLLAKDSEGGTATAQKSSAVESVQNSGTPATVSSQSDQSGASSSGSASAADKTSAQNANMNQNSGESQQNQNRETEEETLRNGSADGQDDAVQEQERSQVQDQSQNQQNSQAGKGGTKEEKNQRSQERRSEVAIAVQAMERIAENNQGIGEQVRVVAQNQKAVQEGAEDMLVKAQNRNAVVRFVIGADYGKLKAAQDKLAEQDAKIKEMQQLAAQIENDGDKQALMEQISTMERIRQEALSEIAAEQGGFSLLGWAFRWFYNR